MGTFTVQDGQCVKLFCSCTVVRRNVGPFLFTDLLAIFLGCLFWGHSTASEWGRAQDSPILFRASVNRQMVWSFPAKSFNKLNLSRPWGSKAAPSTIVHSMLVCCAFFLHTQHCVFLPINSTVASSVHKMFYSSAVEHPWTLLQTSDMQQIFWTAVASSMKNKDVNMCQRFLEVCSWHFRILLPLTEQSALLQSSL